MSPALKAFPHGRPSDEPRTSMSRAVAASGLTLVLVLLVVPGLALPPSAHAVPSPSGAVSASAVAGAAVPTAKPCARKQRKAARKACRAAARSRAAQVNRARAVAVSQARVARAQAASAAAAAARARMVASTTSHKLCAAKKRQKVRAQCHRAVTQHDRAARSAGSVAARAAQEAQRTHQVAVAAVGRPPLRYSVSPGSYFSYPNRSGMAQRAIRSRLLAMIRSTWGGPRDGRVAWAGNGTIRIATWSFSDWQIAKALVGAHRRGVSVQIIAARGANRDHRAWRWLRDRLGARLVDPAVPQSGDRVSFARSCPGSCRGGGGTAHAKYMLFDKVGTTQLRHVVVQTSMNLTSMGFQGQWNQAQVMPSSAVYGDYLAVFRQARLGQRVAVPYHTAALGNVVNYFFPRPQARPDEDPVMQVLSGVRCTGATVGGTRAGRTKIRIVQYAIYGQRGLWIAKRLRTLWRAGCDIRIIYSLSSRPVLDTLRNRRDRGPIPTRQSVLVDKWGWVTGYNHAKWMTITGAWGRSTADHVTLSGSANWSSAAFGNDEQMQLIRDVATARAHVRSFDTTWRQRSTRAPGLEVMGWSLKAE